MWNALLHEVDYSVLSGLAEKEGSKGSRLEPVTPHSLFHAHCIFSTARNRALPLIMRA